MVTYNREKMTELDFKLLKEKYSDRELEEILKKIDDDYPVQYAIGDVDFLGYRILVDERVLIPRFETELLVRKLVDYMKAYSFDNSTLVDVCTGSGCIAVSLKKQLPNIKVMGLDKSLDALEVAKKNAQINDVEVQFSYCDVLEEEFLKDRCDVIVSNPPYVRIDEEVSLNTKYEPAMALYPGEDDLIFYREILKKSKNVLDKPSIIAFEIGCLQASSIVELARESYPDSKVCVEKDYAGFDRFIFIFNGRE